MKIKFYLDDVLYEGTAVPFEKPDSLETQFVVRLEDRDMPVFHVYMSEQGEWASDDLQSAGLVKSVGAEIERQDGEDTPIQPGRYTSTEIIDNGEIINEAEDVDEQSTFQ